MINKLLGLDYTYFEIRLNFKEIKKSNNSVNVYLDIYSLLKKNKYKIYKSSFATFDKDEYEVFFYVYLSKRKSLDVKNIVINVMDNYKSYFKFYKIFLDCNYDYDDY